MKIATGILTGLLVIFFALDIVTGVKRERACRTAGGKVVAHHCLRAETVIDLGGAAE